MLLYKASRSASFDYGAGVSEEPGRICNLATSLKPGDRFQSVRDLRLALTRYHRQNPSRDLSGEARAVLRRLEEIIPQGSDDVEVQARFSECRFAFKQAL